MPADSSLPPAFCLLGPTACGKTALAVELVQRYPLEIISVDSALVYRGLDIGSGKPDAATQAIAPHRLIDIRDPAEAYSASEFRQDAIQAMREILAAGKYPLLVGGTMLYFKALRDGLAAMPPASPEIRARILALAEAEGWPAVHARLQQVDPQTAARLHPTDPQRLQRALEVYELTGRPLSSFHAEQSAEAPDLPCSLHFTGMLPVERAALHARIAERFRAMLDAGLIEEVVALHKRPDLHPGLPAIRSVGYRQVWQYLDGECSESELPDKAIAATRQLAKRQLTWLRSWPELCPLHSQLDLRTDLDFFEKYLKKLNKNAIYW